MPSSLIRNSLLQMSIQLETLQQHREKLIRHKEILENSIQQHNQAIAKITQQDPRLREKDGFPGGPQQDASECKIQEYGRQIAKIEKQASRLIVSHENLKSSLMMSSSSSGKSGKLSLKRFSKARRSTMSCDSMNLCSKCASAEEQPFSKTTTLSSAKAENSCCSANMCKECASVKSAAGRSSCDSEENCENCAKKSRSSSAPLPEPSCDSADCCTDCAAVKQRGKPSFCDSMDVCKDCGTKSGQSMATNSSVTQAKASEVQTSCDSMSVCRDCGAKSEISFRSNSLTTDVETSCDSVKFCRACASIKPVVKGSRWSNTTNSSIAQAESSCYSSNCSNCGFSKPTGKQTSCDSMDFCDVCERNHREKNSSISTSFDSFAIFCNECRSCKLKTLDNSISRLIANMEAIKRQMKKLFEEFNEIKPKCNEL